MAVPLWRVTGRTRIPDADAFGLAIVATYQRPDWALITDLVERLPTVIMAAAHNREHAGRTLTLGAFGYVPVTMPAEALRRTILATLDGEPAYSRRLLAERLRVLTKPQFSGKTLVLTPRQREVVTLIAKGAADKEIATTLGISTATAQKHVTNVLRRLKVPNRAAAAALLVSQTSWLKPLELVEAPGLEVPALRSAS